MAESTVPAEKLLSELRTVADAAFKRLRGSFAACEFADKIEREYGSLADDRLRRGLAHLCAWLRVP
jgi:hypothetical protein